MDRFGSAGGPLPATTCTVSFLTTLMAGGKLPGKGTAGLGVGQQWGYGASHTTEALNEWVSMGLCWAVGCRCPSDGRDVTPCCGCGMLSGESRTGALWGKCFGVVQGFPAADKQLPAAEDVAMAVLP